MATPSKRRRLVGGSDPAQPAVIVTNSGGAGDPLAYCTTGEFRKACVNVPLVRARNGDGSWVPGRVQASVAFQGGPNGLLVVHYPHGNLQTLVPVLVALERALTGPKWQGKPQTLLPVLQVCEGDYRVGGVDAHLVNAEVLLRAVALAQGLPSDAMRDAVQHYLTAHPVKKTKLAVATFVDAACRVAADAALPRLPAAAEIVVCVRMPVVDKGGVALFYHPHGNDSPKTAAATAATKVYICHYATAAMLRGKPAAAADFRALTQAFKAGRPFQPHGGSGHDTSRHVAWLAREAGLLGLPKGTAAPPLPGMTAVEADFFFDGAVPAEGKEEEATMAPRVVDQAKVGRVLTHGFAVINPSDLSPDVDGAAWRAAVDAAEAECDTHFCDVVFKGRGVAVPAGDPYVVMRGYKEAEAAVPGHKYIMNKDEGPVARCNSLASRMSGMGAATQNSRGPAVVSMLVNQGVLRSIVEQAHGSRAWLSCDRFRAKPNNLKTGQGYFALHTDCVNTFAA